MELEDVIRVGVVSDVDKDEYKAKVIFPGQDNMVSAWLPVIRNRPLVTIERNYNAEIWEYEAYYHSIERELGLGETYVKGDKTAENQYDGGSYEVYETLKPDVIINKKGEDFRQIVKVYSWLPYINQLVLCVYLPVFNGNGFIVGGF